MADKSAIEWTDATWNPTKGCSRVSSGCDFCYAIAMARRQDVPGGAYEGLTRVGTNGTDWSGRVVLAPDHTLTMPLRWKRPRRVFVDSMSDLFHPAVPDEWIDRVWGVMALAPRHTFQILTKRPERVATLVPQLAARHTKRDGSGWPLANVWLGVSVEDQRAADERIPLLLQTPAAVRFLSCEPLLGPIAIADYLPGGEIASPCFGRGVDWVICGGESGPGARPMHPDWARSLRDQCTSADVPFFFKQHGAWAPCGPVEETPGFAGGYSFTTAAGARVAFHLAQSYGQRYRRLEPGPVVMERVGKKAAGRVLAGRTWDAMPEPAPER